MAKAKPRQPFKGFTVEQLKQLCQASKVPVSGTKDALIQRLLTDANAAKYAFEPKRVNYMALLHYRGGYDSGDESPFTPEEGPTGVSVDDLKQEARQAGLVVSGKRFDLILRLLQTTNGIGNPKRGRGEVAEDGSFVPQKRAKSMKLPDPEALADRVAAKVYVNKNKWSNQKFKDHAMGVLSLINKIIETEVFEKQLVERGEAVLAWNVCAMIFADFVTIEDSGMTGWGYISSELGDLVQHLRKLAEATVATVADPATRALLAGHATWVSKLLGLKAYGHEEEEMDGIREVCSNLQSLAA